MSLQNDEIEKLGTFKSEDDNCDSNFQINQVKTLLNKTFQQFEAELEENPSIFGLSDIVLGGAERGAKNDCIFCHKKKSTCAINDRIANIGKEV